MAAPALAAGARIATGALGGAGTAATATGAGRGALQGMAEGRTRAAFQRKLGDAAEQSGAASGAGQRLSAELLAGSWRLLIASFGATLIYINFHFVMRYMGHSRWFSDFGQALRFGKMRIGGKGTEFAEILAMGTLDLLALIAFVVLFIMTLIAALPLLIPIIGIGTVINLFGCPFLTTVSSIIGSVVCSTT